MRFRDFSDKFCPTLQFSFQILFLNAHICFTLATELRKNLLEYVP
ncbi:hypothetical protein SFB21_1824 [Acinetobacter bouvetii]|uniref:Uncharacterized protein n=1 Tax=Acinetobacter bouvetii TaxID=202951 RepID=A0A811GE77_9GAMM|nr:hypothetical protein SFB21_1824 [Acinetobacter bouvetii]